MKAAAVRFGLLSTAPINAEILAAAGESELAEVVAVASRDAARATAYANQHGIPRSYGDYQALLDDPDVDAVYVSLPNALHTEWSIRALEAGKHVLCEKPFSRHPHEVERAFDAAEHAGRWLTEGLVSRHHPQGDRVVELVESGAVGELRALSAAFSFSLDDPENTRLRPELEGGALMDVGCYCVSSLRAVAGEPERVYAEQVRGPSGVDLRAVAALHFPGDVLGRIEVGMDLPYRHELEVVGSDGSLFLPDPWHAVAPVIEVRRNGTARSSGSVLGLPTRSCASSRTCARQSEARRSLCSDAPTPSGRRARWTRCCGRQQKGHRSALPGSVRERGGIPRSFMKGATNDRFDPPRHRRRLHHGAHS